MIETPTVPIEPPKPRTSFLPLVTFSMTQAGVTTNLCTTLEGPGVEGIRAGLVAAVDRLNADPEGGSLAHANCRQIICTEVNHDVYQPYVDNGGRNGRKAKPIHAMQPFVSETEAMLHIGCLKHEIAQGICRAKKAGLKEAKVRGATFRYADDLDVGD